MRGSFFSGDSCEGFYVRWEGLVGLSGRLEKERGVGWWSGFGFLISQFAFVGSAFRALCRGKVLMKLSKPEYHYKIKLDGKQETGQHY